MPLHKPYWSLERLLPNQHFPCNWMPLIEAVLIIDINIYLQIRIPLK